MIARRQALHRWCLDPGTWHQITSRLPPVPGPVQPILDDRKRQEASAFVWAHITQGELRFAPRPIEDKQPEPVRRTWIGRRGATRFQLTRPDPLSHYAELRKLVIEHAEHVAKNIDRPSMAKVPIHIATERLLIRPLALTDIEAMDAVFSDPEVMRFVPRRACDREHSRARLQSLIHINDSTA